MLNTELPYVPAILLQGTYPRELKTYVQIETCPEMFITALVKKGKLPKYLSVDGYTTVVCPVNGILFSHKWNNNTLYNINEPWKHHSKWKKADTKHHTEWFHLNGMSRMCKFMETESRLVVSRGWSVTI